MANTGKEAFQDGAIPDKSWPIGTFVDICHDYSPYGMR